MSQHTDAVLMIGLSVQALGLSIEDISKLPEWEDNEYLKDGVYLGVEYENAYTGPEDYDTYIGFNMSNKLDLENAGTYKTRFKELFGQEPKTLLFSCVY
tara:strand:+ start:1241 stop:1537 length:297 start_codon:yes stop_codon:yes gene_type:complete